MSERCVLIVLGIYVHHSLEYYDLVNVSQIVVVSYRLLNLLLLSLSI